MNEPVIGLYVGGVPGSGSFVSTTKYNFGSNVSTVGENLSFARGYTAACGNQEFACIGGTGNTINSATDQYFYSSNMVRLYVNLKGKTKCRMGAASTDSIGYFFGGTLTGYPDQSSDVDRVSFAAQAVVSMTALDSPRSAAVGCGNTTMAYFGGGFSCKEEELPVSYNTVVKYQYAGDIRSSGSSLATVAHSYAAASNNLMGIFSSGNNGNPNGTSFTSRYNFALDIVACGTSLSVDRTSTAAMGNTTHAMFAGSIGPNAIGSAARLDSYNYATNAVNSTSSLNTSRSHHGATSNSHGGLSL